MIIGALALQSKKKRCNALYTVIHILKFRSIWENDAFCYRENEYKGNQTFTKVIFTTAFSWVFTTVEIRQHLRRQNKWSKCWVIVHLIINDFTWTNIRFDLWKSRTQSMPYIIAIMLIKHFCVTFFLFFYMSNYSVITFASKW